MDNTYVKMFINHVFLPALSQEARFDRMNFGASYTADQELFRNQMGHIYPHASLVEEEHLEDLVERMRVIINGTPTLARFRGFFFDTWCRGIKNAYTYRESEARDPEMEALRRSVRDIEWEFIDKANSYIDFAIEALPGHSYNAPSFMGLPMGYAYDISKTLRQAFFFNPGRGNRIACHVSRYVFAYMHSNLYIHSNPII